MRGLREDQEDMLRKQKCDDGSNLEYYQPQPQEFKMFKALHTHAERHIQCISCTAKKNIQLT